MKCRGGSRTIWHGDLPRCRPSRSPCPQAAVGTSSPSRTPPATAPMARIPTPSLVNLTMLYRIARLGGLHGPLLARSTAAMDAVLGDAHAGVRPTPAPPTRTAWRRKGARGVSEEFLEHFPFGRPEVLVVGRACDPHRSGEVVAVDLARPLEETTEICATQRSLLAVGEPFSESGTELLDRKSVV